MIQVIQGDCLKVLPQIQAKSIDLVVTSPPYNLGIDYGSYKDNRPHPDYLAWCGEWLSQVQRVLTEDGSLFVVVADLPSNPYLSTDLTRIASKYFHLQNRIIWCKSINVKGRSHGHHRPITSNRYLDVTHETVLHLSKKGSVSINRHTPGVGVPYQDPTNSTRWQHDRSLRCPGTTWFVPQPTINQHNAKRIKHPATFPVRLAEKCIRLHGVKEGLHVLDPFGGLGTTGVAAKRCGVSCTSIEIDPVYVAAARRRIDKASDKVQMMMF